MTKIKYAATIILSRGPDHDPEVYLARRAPEIRFFGDYWVFPGGNVSSGDYADDDSDLDSAFRRCVVREVDEEINISVRPQDLQAVFRITTPPFAPVLFDTQFMHASARRTVSIHESMATNWSKATTSNRQKHSTPGD